MNDRSREMPAPARVLLRQLQGGDDVAIPSVYVHSLAFSDHARLYFDNAAAISRPDGVGDFRVFAALYSLRHGLELWLKCLLRNDLIDRFLAQVFAVPEAEFTTLADSLGLSRKERVPFQRSLCCLRNVLVDGIKFPEADPWRQRMETRWADEAIEFLRQEPHLPRSRFAMSCHVRLPGHNVKELWEAARSHAACFIAKGETYAQRIAVPTPASGIEEIGALAELVAFYDEDGDAFRYPSSLDGGWHTELPHLDPVRLGELAGRMHDTVLCTSSLRSDAYDNATVSRPGPCVSGV
jgi:hypothetical protein